MKKEFITIQVASELSKKSIQTIRRAIKAKKIKTKKQKTPQGFNYLIDKDSLESTFNIKITKNEFPKKNTKKEEATTKTISNTKAKKISLETEDFAKFVQTMEAILAQHSEERKSFLGLINTMQEKIYVLENQLNLLKAPPKKKWFSFLK